ncbi:MAG: septation protein SepH, partial [Actinomycetota bacterium]|nr:septation protein SepH [Actinomycetota bacterium]
MEQLHLVGFTTDHKGLILGPRKDSTSGGYVVMIDDPLIDQIEELLRLRIDKDARRGTKTDKAGIGGRPLLTRPRPESRLTPREVQAMLRTGQTIGQVAEAAGVAEDWVARFAPPVMAEQAQVIERTGRMFYHKPRIGPSTQPLAESVAWNLVDRGVELSDDGASGAWTAFQQGAGRWVVRITYPARGRDHHADWVVNLAEGTLTAVSRRASELGYVEAGRKRPAGLPAIKVTAAQASRAGSAGAPVQPSGPTPPSATPRPTITPSFARTTSSPTARGALDPPDPFRRPPPSRPTGSGQTRSR